MSATKPAKRVKKRKSASSNVVVFMVLGFLLVSVLGIGVYFFFVSPSTTPAKPAGKNDPAQLQSNKASTTQLQSKKVSVAKDNVAFSPVKFFNTYRTYILVAGSLLLVCLVGVGIYYYYPWKKPKDVDLDKDKKKEPTTWQQILAFYSDYGYIGWYGGAIIVSLGTLYVASLGVRKGYNHCTGNLSWKMKANIRTLVKRLDAHLKDAKFNFVPPLGGIAKYGVPAPPKVGLVLQKADGTTTNNYPTTFPPATPVGEVFESLMQQYNNDRAAFLEKGPILIWQPVPTVGDFHGITVTTKNLENHLTRFGTETDRQTELTRLTAALTALGCP